MINVKEQESSHLVKDVDYTRDVAPLVSTDAYEMRQEVVNGILFYHIDVFDFSPSIYKSMKKDWGEIKDRAKKDGWYAVHSYTQNHSFVRKFGGVQIATIKALSGEDYGVYRWELKS